MEEKKEKKLKIHPLPLNFFPKIQKAGTDNQIKPMRFAAPTKKNRTLDKKFKLRSQPIKLEKENTSTKALSRPCLVGISIEIMEVVFDDDTFFHLSSFRLYFLQRSEEETKDQDRRQSFKHHHGHHHLIIESCSKVEHFYINSKHHITVGVVVYMQIQ